MPKNASVERALAAIAEDETKKLGVSLNGQKISTAQYVGRADAQKEPELSYAVPDTSAKYMVVALDLDAPFPSWTGLGPILHWIQPGLTADSTGKLVANEPFVANYIGPAPPPGSGPHRYSFYLFAQPASFDGSKYAPAGGQPLSNWYRMRYDLDGWIAKTGLGEPIASNYFTSN